MCELIKFSQDNLIIMNGEQQEVRIHPALIHGLSHHY